MIDIEPFINIILAIITGVLALLNVKIVTFVLNHMKRFQKDPTLIMLISDILKYIIYVVAIIIIFSLFGIDLQAIFVSIGIVGIAISLAAKDIISNLMSGLLITSDKSLKVGDIIEINGMKGTVKKISLRTTLIEDDKGVIITIPNATLSKTAYQKFQPDENKRIDINVILPLSINIEDFKKNILKTISEKSWVLENPSIKILAKEITSEGTMMKISVWITNFNKKEEYKIIITNEIREYVEEK